MFTSNFDANHFLLCDNYKHEIIMNINKHIKLSKNQHLDLGYVFDNGLNSSNSIYEY